MRARSSTRKKKTSKSRLLPYIFLVLVGGLLWLLLIRVQKFFSVQSVECYQTTGTPCSSELLEKLTLLYHQPLFFTDYSQLLPAHNSFGEPVTVVSYQKKLPHTLIVTVKPEQAAYVIQSNGQSFVISQSGNLFPSPNTSNQLTVVEMSNFPPDATAVYPDIHHTLITIITTSHDLQLPLTRIIWVDKSTIKLSMNDRAETFILDSERPKLELHRLAIILRSSEYKSIIEPKTELDLRFTMPVLRMQP